MEDTVINFGSEIKALSTAEDGTVTVGGYLVVFGSPDEHDATPMRDYFTKSTDFDIEDGDKTTVYYHHGLDPTLKARKLGTGTLSIKDAGVWFEAQMRSRDEYEAKIMAMVKAGKLGLSSGTANHLVERERVGQAHHIKRWPLGLDASLTPTPGEPRTVCMSLKALMDEEAAAQELTTAQETEQATSEQPEPATPETKHQPNFTTSTEVVTAAQGLFASPMPFDWHLLSARAAVKSVEERFSDFIEDRCIKSGRVLSADNHATFCSWCDSLESIAKEMREKLEAHAPESKTATDTKSLDAELDALELEWLESEARRLGVPV